MDYTNPFLNPTGAVTDAVQGAHGFTRHVGSFSEDNTYYQQILAIEQSGNVRNQDIDALYERAIEEQARLDNLAMTTELDWLKLQEQRAYDSPEQQVARARAAGINPELSGGSSSSAGGSTSAMPATNIEPVQGQTKFKNQYDDVALALNGISTASNLLTAVGSFSTSIIDSVAKIKKLPLEYDLLETQAHVAKETADNTIALSGKAVNQADLNLASSDLANISSNLRILGDLGTYITPETSDEDALKTFSMLGFDDEKSKAWLPRLRQYQQTPAYQADIENAERRRRADSVYNDVYTADFLTDIADMGSKIQRMQAQCQVHRSKVEENIASMLALDANYAKNSANAQIVGASNLAGNAEFEAKKLTHSIFAYSQRVNDSVKAIKEIDKAINEFRKEDKGLDELQRSAVIRGLQIKRQMLMTSGQQEFNNVYDLISDYNSQLYLSSYMLQPNGQYQYIHDNVNAFNQITFGQFVNGTVSYNDWKSNLMKYMSNVYDRHFKQLGLEWDATKFYQGFAMDMTGKMVDMFSPPKVINNYNQGSPSPRR